MGITKAFGPLLANDHVDLTLEEGEIHCLLGENGAGKSTLMNILFGLLHADSGEIRIDGEAVRFADPGDAVRRGIGMVHQHFMLVPVFTVAENIVLGFEPVKRFGFLDRRQARADIRRLSREFGLDVPPDALVENLPVGAQQKVEILKALMRDAQVLILDEPTAVLTPQETEGLFQVIRSLTESGRSVLFITHKLKEVLAVADRITVMRLGKVVGHTTAQESDEAELAAMMVGRSVELVVSKAAPKPGPPVLELKDVTVQDERGLTVVDHVSLTVRSGEIVALAGVQGNGQTELAEAVTGLRTVSSGSIHLSGRGPYERQSPAGTAGRGGKHPRRPPGRRARPVHADLGQPRARRLRPGALRPPWRQEVGRRQTGRAAQAHRVRHPGQLGRHAGRDFVGRQPAEGGGGPRAVSRVSPSLWPRSPPGGSMLVRSSTSTGGSSTSATGGPVFCWSPPSSTRFWRSATGSPSCTGAGSSASSHRVLHVTRSA